MVVDLKVYNKDKYKIKIASKNKNLKIEKYSNIILGSTFKRKNISRR